MSLTAGEKAVAFAVGAGATLAVLYGRNRLRQERDDRTVARAAIALHGHPRDWPSDYACVPMELVRAQGNYR